MSYSNRFSIRTLLANKQGLALVEFALCAPLLLMLIFGVVEITRFIVIMQKVERASYALSNMTVQYLPAQDPHVSVLNEISEPNVRNAIFPQLARIMYPDNAAGNLRAIITSVVNTAVDPAPPNIILNWQISGAGSLNNADTVSVVNGFTPPDAVKFNAEIEGYLAGMQQGENIIIVEVFFNYQPIFSDILTRFGAPSLAQRTLIARTYSLPRAGNLLTLPNS